MRKFHFDDFKLLDNIYDFKSMLFLILLNMKEPSKYFFN